MAEGRLGTRAKLRVGSSEYSYYRLEALERQSVTLTELPYSIRVMLEGVLRRAEEGRGSQEEVETMMGWRKTAGMKEFSFEPARVLLQDFTGVPVIADLAAMRDAIRRLGGDPAKVNPLKPSDLVIDHSVQVDAFGTTDAFARNAQLEFERNRERYLFLRWGQTAFRNFRVVPPDTGIVHQVNLEYLAPVVVRSEAGVVYPDTVIGTDSHTPMINGLGVVGWGVGGIEAEAAMLGEPIPMLVPEVIGVRLTGSLAPGATATDLVLTITEILRKKGVVGKFVEYFGPGVKNLAVADRATLGNMSPEYGATIGYFPIDQQTLDYLRLTGRPPEHVALVETYYKAQGLFRSDNSPDPKYSDVVELDLGSIEPSIAGPRRPQDRVQLSMARRSFRNELVADLQGRGQLPDERCLSKWIEEGGSPSSDAAGQGDDGASDDVLSASVEVTGEDGQRFSLRHGSVLIAAITSCTNTSNPSVMIGAGLLARKARERGLKSQPWVKTSLAPGSKVVTRYLKRAGLMEALEELRFHLVGYGCTTCIGNSGPIPEAIAEAVRRADLVTCAVLSGNRNFEGRINPVVRFNYLASPPLVVAYALAGTLDIDLLNSPLGKDSNGREVFLRDIWPQPEEIQRAIEATIDPDEFRAEYESVFEGDDRWRSLDVPHGELFAWRDESTYVKAPPFFDNVGPTPEPLRDIVNARVLALLGDSVTTDHISPAGTIAPDSPAGKYLIAHGVEPRAFNSYGARRGNHEVMVRGTFANIRLRNRLVPGVEGGFTLHLPDGERMTIFEAAERYRQEQVPLLVIAGKEYGSGSSRDWAAKGVMLLGVKAVIAQSYERIHRSNLVGMGVLPLEFAPGENAETLGLTGRERYTIEGLAEGLTIGKQLTVSVDGDNGQRSFKVKARVDTPAEVNYIMHGGILPYVLRRLLNAS